MEADIILIASIACAAAGAAAYTILTALARYRKQKTDAEKLRSKIAENGRDPTDLAQLNAAERWEITKAEKFDRTFIIVDIVAILLSTAASVGLLYVFGPQWITETWEDYAIVGGVLGILAAWIFDQTVIDAIATCTWQAKTAEAFRIAKTAVAEPDKATSILEDLIAKFTAAGIDKKEAKEMAKDYIFDHPEVLQPKE